MMIHDRELSSLRALVPDPSEVVLLVGSGISIPSPSNMPSWEAATLKALETSASSCLSRTATEYAREECDSGRYYEVFRLLKEKLASAVYQQLISDVFSDQAGKPNKLHRSIASSNVKGILTTNFDRFVETAYVQEGNATPLIVAYSEESKLRNLLSRMDRFFVMKLHGDIQIPSEMVLTSDQCQAVASTTLVHDLFRQIVTHYQLVILGYGMGDPDFWHVWRTSLSELYLRKPAIICTESGWQTEKASELKAENIHVIEFNNDDGSFGFTASVLEVLASSSESATEASILPAEDISGMPHADDHVYLYCQLTDDHAGRLVSFISALCVGELLDCKTANGEIPVEQIRGRVRRALGVSRTRIQEEFTSAMTSLKSRGIIDICGEAAKLVPEWRKRLEQCHDELSRIEDSILTTALNRASEEQAIDSEHINNLRALLEHVLMWLGTELAEQVLFLKVPTAGDRARLHEVVKEFCACNSLNVERYLSALEYVLSPDTVGGEDWLSEKLRAQFLTSAYVMHPTSEVFLKEYAGSHILYLDSSVALPLLAPHHPLHRPYLTLMRHSLRLGVELRVSREMIDEIKGHLRNAIKQYQRIDGGFVQQNLEAYIELTGELHGNVFLEGYLNCLHDKQVQSWGDYISLLCTVRGGELLADRRKIGEYCQEFLSISPDTAKSRTEDEAELNRLTQQIYELRGRRRHRDEGAAWKLSLNEAAQFLRVHRERAQEPNGEHLIWFLTTDTRLAQLQEMEIERYPFPIGYTPHNWSQYINILDFEHRSSRHFARLLRRTEYGLVTGNIAIGLVSRLSAKLRKAKAAAAEARIQDLIRSFFHDYHLKKAVRDSTRKETLGLSPDKLDVEKMEQALDEFVVKAKDDWESLKMELDQERERSETFCRELETAKRLSRRKDYRIRVLRGEQKKTRD